MDKKNAGKGAAKSGASAFTDKAMRNEKRNSAATMDIEAVAKDIERRARARGRARGRL